MFRCLLIDHGLLKCVVVEDDAHQESGKGGATKQHTFCRAWFTPLAFSRGFPTGTCHHFPLGTCHRLATRISADSSSRLIEEYALESQRRSDAGAPPVHPLIEGKRTSRGQDTHVLERVEIPEVSA